MAFSRWEPYRELAAMQGELRRLMNQLSGVGGEAREAEGQTWLPPVDAWETESDLVLAFDLPGVSPDQLRIEVDEGTLVVEGERSRGDVGGQRYYRAERRFGSFARSIPLPPGVEEQQIRADHRDGVLVIRISKPQQRRPRRIELSTAPPTSGEPQGGGETTRPAA